MLKPETDAQLHDWIRTFLGIHIPRVSVTDGHNAPFDFIADSYFRRVRSPLVLASRGSGKTLSLAILNLLRSKYFPKCATGHYAAVEAQGDEGMRYLVEFVTKSYLRKDLARDPVKSYVEWTNGSWVQRGSGYGVKGVTGAHPQRFVGDEIDQWNLAEFQTALLMVSGTDANPPERLLASTAYTAYGLLTTTLIPQAKRRNLSLYKWGFFECLKRCEECRGKKCELYQWEHPRTGKIELLCGGRAVHSDGFVPLQDAIDEYLLVDAETFLVQKLVRDPSRSNLIYPRFDSDKHCKKPPENILNIAQGIGVGIDWGFDHPLVFTVFAELPNGIYYGLEEFAERFCTPDRELEIANMFRDKYGQETVFYAGFDQPKSVAALAENNFIVVVAQPRGRDDGHRHVRRMLDRKLLYLDPDNMPMSVFQLGSIHKDKRGKEVLKDNDFADSSRHVLAIACEYGGIAGGGHLIR